MKNATDIDSNSDKLRMNGFVLGAILFAASLLVASSMTAVVNLVLIAIPVLTIAAVIGIFAVGIPLVFAGIQAGKEAKANEATAHDSAVLLSLEGFWQHAHSWDKGHAHFQSFQPIDHDIVIHLDSKSDDQSMTMSEFMQMTSSPRVKPQNVELEKSLEGLSDYRRV